MAALVGSFVPTVAEIRATLATGATGSFVPVYR
jgi:hypothetical protein